METNGRDRRDWVVVVADGDDLRLDPLLRLLGRPSCPRQYARILANRSLLELAVERAVLVAGSARVALVVAPEHAALAREQLARHREVTILTRPRQLGHASGLAFLLSTLGAQHAGARVVVMPADHYVARAEPFVAAVQRMVGGADESIVVLGVSAGVGDADNGWIIPGRLLSSGRRAIDRLVEDPARPLARRLRREGALWNSSVIAGTIESLLAMASSEVSLGQSIARAPDRFAVETVGGCGWSDWGTLERVLLSLEGTPELEPLLRRIMERDRRSASTTVAITESCDETRMDPWTAHAG